jgi:diguanylate cyclase (GGDEF)-like protein
MPEFSRSEARSVALCVTGFIEMFRREVASVLAAELRGVQPAEVNELIAEAALVERQLDAKTKEVRVHDAHAPLLKRALIEARREQARSIDGPLHKTTDGQVIRMLRRELHYIEHLMSASWFADVVPLRVPALTDYLSIRHAEAASPEALVLRAREYDEKFHILEAPSLFLPDLAHYRRRCRFRRAPVAVAYADIDDFKTFNTRHGETTVDRDLLAPFMEAMEAHVFGHGHAYRFGGDEYVILLPNMGRVWAVDFLRALQARIAATSYRHIPKGPTISVGLAVALVDTALIDRELLERANAAKGHAKATRKGSIATFEGELLRDADLVIA